MWKKRSETSIVSEYWRELNGKEITNIKKDYVVKSWKLISNKLISEPNSTTFINPLRINDIKQAIFIKWRLQQIAILSVILLLGVFLYLKDPSFNFLVNSATSNGITLLIYNFLFILFTVFSLRTPIELAERSEFYSFISSKSLKLNIPIYVLFLFTLYISSDSIFPYGDKQSLYSSYATINTNITKGEVWRFFTGPLIHSGFIHAFMNYFLLIFIFPLTAIYSKIFSLSLLVIGGVMSHVCFVLFSQLHGEQALIGISGGVFSLLGGTIMFSIFKKHKYPKKFTFFLISTCSVLLVATENLNPVSSLTAHISGLTIGALISMCWLKKY